MYYFHLLEMSSQNKDSLHSSRKDLQNLIYRTSTVSQTGNKPHSHSQFTPNVFTDRGSGGGLYSISVRLPLFIISPLSGIFKLF